MCPYGCGIATQNRIYEKEGKEQDEDPLVIKHEIVSLLFFSVMEYVSNAQNTRTILRPYMYIQFEILQYIPFTCNGGGSPKLHICRNKVSR